MRDYGANPETPRVIDLLPLRKPFPPEQIGKLPRGRIELDYVGHADVTARLLEVDERWYWEPLATDEHGLPLFDLDRNGNPVGLWIKLTVGDVTRLGYGSVPSNQNDAVKVLIGDALRNAAMRFGVALDLWAKGDRADPTMENATASAGQVARKAQKAEEPPKPVLAKTVKTAIPAKTLTSAEFGKLIESAKSPDELNAVWKAAGAAGQLGAEVVAGDEKLTIRALLYKRNDELGAKKSPRGTDEDSGSSEDDQ